MGLDIDWALVAGSGRKWAIKRGGIGKLAQERERERGVTVHKLGHSPDL